MSTESENPGTGSRADAAHRAIESLAEMEPELRAAALFAGDGETGELLASTGDSGWAADAAELLGALREASRGEFDSAHIALDQGEVFVATEAGYTLVATTQRFVLASLTGFDARMCLRDLAAEWDPGDGTGRES